jgi:hypothetical protein
MCYVIYYLFSAAVSAMHHVGSVGNPNNSTRPRKEKRLTYVLNDSDDTKVTNYFLILSILEKWPSFMFVITCFFTPIGLSFDICLKLVY